MQANLPARIVDFCDYRHEFANPVEEDVSRYPDFASLRRVGAGNHYQVELADHFGRGRGEVCVFSGGMFFQSIDVALTNGYSASVVGPDTLRIRVGTSGDCRYSGAQGAAATMSGHALSLVAEPTGMQPAQVLLQDHQRSVSVYLYRSELASLYAGAEQDLPAPILAFLHGELPATYIYSAMPSSELLDCTSAIMSCNLDGRSRSLFFRSKAVEIVCRTFDAMSAAAPDALSSLSAPTRRAIIRAKAILDREFVNPPALEALARAVGLSRTGLTSGFRRLIGKSVYDYVTDIRMRQAVLLLGMPGARVADVAYRLGYTHPSNFSAAVSKALGTHPRALREQSRQTAAKT